MDAQGRFKRYRRKDYSEVVDFPVEIVGRDGVVRRYDYEESIRLYQRRLHFAPIRFREGDLVSAEQGHCRARIEQLRRSYFQLFGWGGMAGQEGPEARRREHAGELAAFLVRSFRCSGRLSLRFQPVEGPPGRQADMWYLERHGRPGGLLLYAFAFAGSEAEPAQVEFFDLLAGLRRGSTAGGDAERLVAWHHVADCGFVLTGRADEVGDVVAAGVDGEAAVMETTPWDEIVDFVHRGDLPTAFLRCRWLVQEQPWHRDAYAAGAMMAIALRRPEDAEDLAYVGTRYVTHDALLHYYLGLSRVHQGRQAEAQSALRRALELSPGLTAARTLLALSFIESARLVQAMAVMKEPEADRSTADGLSHDELRGVMRRFGWFLLAGSVAVVVTVMAMASMGRPALVFFAMILVLALVGMTLFRRRFDAIAHRHRFEDVANALSRFHRRQADSGPS